MAEIENGIISILIAVSVIVATKIIEKTKLDDIYDSQKILGIITILTVFGEVVYLSITFGLLQFALETITSIGVGIVFLGVAFQNKLKNAVAGISIAFNPRINRGDFVEVEHVRGIIVQLRLTKTIVETKEGTKVMIPNVKFDEEIIRIEAKQKKNKKTNPS